MGGVGNASLFCLKVEREKERRKEKGESKRRKKGDR